MEQKPWKTLGQSKRLVSLVPSHTETLCELFGLEEEVVATTSFCTHPKSLFRKKVSAGGTKDPNWHLILSKNPTHIFFDAQENRLEDYRFAQDSPELAGVKLLATDVNSLDTALESVKEMSEFLNQPLARPQWELEVKKHREALLSQKSLKGSQNTVFLYFIWKDPWMVVGPNTYSSDLLSLGGWKNACLDVPELACRPYPSLSHESLALLAKSVSENEKKLVVLFGTEPYAFKKRHLVSFETFWMHNCPMDLPPLKIVDGQNLSWFGWRTNHGLQLVQQLYKNV